MTGISLATSDAASAAEPVKTRLKRAVLDESPTEARVIVKFRAAASDGSSARIAAAGGDTAALRRAQTMGQRHGLTLADGNTIAPRTQVLKASGLSSAALAARLAADPDVEYVEIDRRMRAHAAPNDPLYATNPANSPAAGQWYLRAPTSELVASINAEGAWGTTNGSADVVVAVLDTGVRPEHPDLVGKLLPGYDFISDANIANDGNGRDGDPTDPGDWVTADDIAANRVASTCVIEDSSWHGTQMAGLVGAATHNNFGMAGVGRHVMVLPVRVLGKCGGFVSDIVAGMRWAAGLSVAGVPANTHAARVLNMSLGGEGACSPTYQSAVNDVIQAGAVVVSSGGNEGLSVDMPANCNGVIAVGGVRHSGTKNGFSSLGPEITISAPGGNCVNTDGQACLYPILSTSNTGSTAPSTATFTDGQVRPAFGTSYASPLVAGTAALMLSIKPTLIPSQISQMLHDSARAFPPPSTDPNLPECVAPTAVEQTECHCTTSTCGAGMLSASAAMLLAAADTTVAHVQATSTQVNIGDTVVLDASASRAADGAPLTAYLWEIVQGGSAASFANGNATAVVTLNTTAQTELLVRLTVTDGRGGTARSSVLIRVGAPPDDINTTTPTSSGGGALGLEWLAALTAAIAALGWMRRRHLGADD